MTDNADGLESLPAPLVLPASYSRHSPTRGELRAAITHVVDTHDWSALTWVELIEALLALGRADIALGRLAEGHIDAVRIAGQAERTVQPDALYGVWASRSGATGVRAEPHGDHLVLNGTVKFASGAGVIDRALLPVWVDDDQHLLVDLDVRELPVDRSAWQTAAMMVSQSHTVQVDHAEVPADSVIGEPNFYLDRPGFFPGGVGVAAVWAGGLTRVLDCLLPWAGDRCSPASDVRFGRISTQRSLAVAAARQGARTLDAAWPTGQPSANQPSNGQPSAGQWQLLSTQVRAGVASAVNTGLAEARVLAGPAGLAYDADVTHALDDLGLYVLQQNADGDAAYLGGQLRR